MYRPWQSEADFRALYKRLEPLTVRSAEQCHLLTQVVGQTADVPGVVAECGVYRGGSAYVMAHAMAESNCQAPFHLFDTFEGAPDGDPEFDGGRQGGEFSDTDLGRVQTLLDRFPGAEFHVGRVPGCFRGRDEMRFRLAHVDLGLFEGTHGALAFFYPRLWPGGMLVVEDYGASKYPGVKSAVDLFMSERPEMAIYVPSGQCLIIRLPELAS